MDKKQIYAGGFAILAIVAGIILNFKGIGQQPYLGFTSAGSWLIYIGIVSILITIARTFRKKEKVVDERMLAVAAKASRIVFLAIIMAAFAIMLIDGVAPIAISLGMFMAYLVCGMMLVYFASYQILLKLN